MIMDLKIDKQNNECMYNDEKHLYWDKEDGSKYVSVTTLIHQFTQEFDEDFWSSYKAFGELYKGEDLDLINTELLKTKKFNNKILKTKGIDENEFLNKKQEFKDQWKKTNEEACTRGTAIHLQHELKYYKDKNNKIPYFGLTGTFKCEKDHTELDIDRGIYPEYLVSKKTKDGKLRIAGQIDLLIKDGNDIYIVDYKGLPLDTPIATIGGWKLLKDLTKNDQIFDKNGNLTNIINISEIHNNPCYKMTFDNGEEIVADHEHRWLISFDNKNGSYRKVIMTTEEISHYLKNNSITISNAPKILNAKPLSLPNKDLPIDPYILGIYLGSESKEYKSELNLKYNITKILNKDSYIPNIYLRSSYSQRINLLRGIMDMIGDFDDIEKCFVVPTKQNLKNNDLIKLITSLGWKIDIVKYNDNYNIYFNANESPFLFKNVNYNLSNNSNFRIIKSVELTETVETKCLEVDSPSHTFLAGYTLIPTHNTNKKLVKTSYFDRKTKKNQMMKYPLNNIMDCNMMHYTLQLSLYAYILQLINPNFNIKQLMIVHFDHEGNETHYNLEYKKKEVEALLKFYKKQIILEERKASRKPIEY